MSEMKISPTDDCIWFNEDFTLMIDGDTPKEAEVAAGKINNHGRMAEELKPKTDMLALVVEEKSRMAEEIAELKSHLENLVTESIALAQFKNDTLRGNIRSTDLDEPEWHDYQTIGEAGAYLAKLNQEGEE